jgi:hypothetical protein
MTIAAINLIFAAIFLWLARAALRRALPFLRTGWQVIDSQVQHPDYRQNVERRRTIGEGSNFLLAGIAWGLAGIGALGLAALLAIQAVASLAG